MTLVISNENVQEALDRKDLSLQMVIDVIESAYRDLSEGKAAYAPRRGVSVPVDEQHRHAEFQDERFLFGVMEGAVESSGYFAIRLKLDVTYQSEDPETGAKTHEKYCMEPGRYSGLILLVDTNTAEPLAILNDGVVQHLRVAATNVIAAKYMARPDARVMGILGSGGMARSHAEMMALVRDLEEIRVYSPTPAHREQFAAEMTEALKIPVRAVNTAESLWDGCQIVAACTDSNEPVVRADSIRPGMFISSVTGVEVDRDALSAIDAVVLHQTIESSTLATYATGLGQVDAKGGIEPILTPPNEAYSRGQKVRGTLAELVSGRIAGRQNGDEVNFFYNNIGSGLQFAAVAGAVYEVVRKMGGTRQIPTDWLTQSIRD